jgi:hypothetical protein
LIVLEAIGTGRAAMVRPVLFCLELVGNLYLRRAIPPVQGAEAMTAIPQREIIEFTAALVGELVARDVPNAANEAGRLAPELIRVANKLQRLAVARCNRELSEREEAADDRAEAKARELVAPFGIEVETSGDPRGAVLKLKFNKSRNGNSWGGENMRCVPSRE